MVSNRELGKKFHSGARKGQSNRMSILGGKKNTYLVDYGWAVLAVRDNTTGKVTCYTGWDGHSSTTSRHISEADLRSKCHRKVNEKKQVSDLRGL